MADQITIIMEDLDKYTRGEIIALALNINANLRDHPPVGTPIDVGWASANWVPSITEPFSDPDIGAIKKPTPAQVAARAQVANAGINDVLSWTPADGPIFSANNVPYIGALNRGHSPQSPSNFILFAIEKAIRQTYARVKSYKELQRAGAAARAGKARPKR